VRLEDVERETLFVQPPDLGDAEGGVDAHAIQRAVRDVHLNAEVWRGVDAQIDFFLPSHPGFVGDPVGIVRLDASAGPSAAERGRAAGRDGEPQLHRQSVDEAPQQICELGVPSGRAYDFQHSPVVGESEARSLGKETEETEISPPIDVVEQERLSGWDASLRHGSTSEMSLNLCRL